MAFLDNSGDIILDAVLTDTGRMRLAKGDGSFKIVKFALGDDEINYGLFNKDDSRGSAYYDLAIMQSPVLEAFTNNTSILKHKLMSFPRTNLLYLPVIKLNDIAQPAAVLTVTTPGTVDSVAATNESSSGTGIFILPANIDTSNKLETPTEAFSSAGSPGILSSDRHIITAQGEDTTEKTFKQQVEADLMETQYIVQLDSRLCSLTNSNMSDNAISPSYIDDDLVASYYLTLDNNKGYVTELSVPTEDDQTPSEAVIAGPKGTQLAFNLKPTEEIRTGTHFFETLGGGAAGDITINSKDYYFIDTNVRVTGATTGYSIDIPVRVMKYYT
tara:strand:+ start:20297 stop:21283 length:987 start_codon:yes stop_codon:yes gene_type:complete